MPSTITRYLNPWRYKRELRDERLASIRQRDGETCTRCRRPIRFELPDGHDMSARIELIRPGAGESIDNLCVTHGRCNARGSDDTIAVRERLRPQREAELFAKSKSKRAA